MVLKPINLHPSYLRKPLGMYPPGLASFRRLFHRMKVGSNPPACRKKETLKDEKWIMRPENYD